MAKQIITKKLLKRYAAEKKTAAEVSTLLRCHIGSVYQCTSKWKIKLARSRYKKRVVSTTSISTTLRDAADIIESQKDEIFRLKFRISEITKRISELTSL